MNDPITTELTTTDQADPLLAGDEPTWLLKHSITCPVSSAGKAQFDRYLAEHPDENAVVVIVQHSRDVSNHIAQVTGVRHESPQAMLVARGRVLWHASHGSITAQSMAGARSDAANA